MSESFSPGPWDPVHENVNGWATHPRERQGRRHPRLPQMEVRRRTVSDVMWDHVLSSEGQYLKK